MNTKKTFMSLSKISVGYDLDPRWAADKWLAEPTTLEFIQLWETLHNLDFKKQSYIELCSVALGTGAAPQVEELHNKAGVKGLFIDREFDGDIFIHRDIAMDFAAWASPAFRTFCLCIMRDGCCDVACHFKSEEDFIISTKTLARLTQKQALKNYQKFNNNFVYNCQCI